jgi:hypothetical protein
MGAGRVLARAIAELRALPADAPERTLALPILLSLRLEIAESPTDKTEEDEELVMITQDIVETYLQKQRDEGRDEGRIEGLRDAVLSVYTERFGAPPAELAAIVARTQEREMLRGWLRRMATASADEALAAIRAQAAQ